LLLSLQYNTGAAEGQLIFGIIFTKNAKAGSFLYLKRFKAEKEKTPVL